VRYTSLCLHWSLIHSQLDMHMHKSLNYSGHCMEKLRTSALYLVLLKIHVYVINRTVMYCLCTEHIV